MRWSPNALRALSVIALLAVAGCAAPGKEDLVAQGIQERLDADGDYERLAKCVVERFDAEPWALGDLQTPVTSFRHFTADKTIELIAGAPASAQVYLWSATIKQGAVNQVKVEVIARRDVNPYLSGRYMIDKVMKNFRSCSA
jgi:hypothetical protein